MGQFHGAVQAWCDKVLHIYIAAFRISAQYMLEDILDATPVDTGYLRASMTVTLNTPEPMTEFASGGGMAESLGAVALGDTLYATYTAIYAARIEHGFNGTDSLGRNYNQSGHYMISDHLDLWQYYVDLAAEDVKGANL